MSINEIWEKLIEQGDGLSIGEHCKEAIVSQIKPLAEMVFVDLTKSFCCPDSVHQEESSVD